MIKRENIGMPETLTSCILCESVNLRPIDPIAQLCECGQCGYVFNNPRPSSDEIVEFYSQPKKYDTWLTHEVARDDLWERRLRKVQAHAVPGRLLDVGTGTGQFLVHALKVFSSVAGTEVSLEAIRVATDKYGLDVLQGEVQDIGLPDQSFDNITMFHVLEHVHDPRSALRACHRLLVRGGRLFIAVPNDRRFLTRTRGAALLARAKVAPALGRTVPRPTLGWSGLPALRLDGEVIEIHLSHFTAPVLNSLIEQEGFRVLDLSADPYFVATGPRLVAHWGLYRAGALLTQRNVYLYPALWLVAEKR